MGKADDYRHMAAECRRTADLTVDIAAKLKMLEMASVWLDLAEEAEEGSNPGEPEG
jgi:hypothetical protein